MNIFLVSLAVAMEPLAIAHALADECVFEEALEFLSKAPVQDQATEENIIFKAQLLAHTGHASEAILLLKKKDVSHDKSLEVKRLVALSAALATNKQLESAIDTARQARRLGADRDIVDGIVAVANLASGKISTAERILREVLRRDPLLSGSIYNLACLRAAKGDLTESAALIRFAWMLGYRNPSKLKNDPWLAPVRAKKGLIDDLLDSTDRRCRIF